MEKHSVIYRQQPIEFELRRKNVKNVNVNVKPDMSILVSANPGQPLQVLRKVASGGELSRISLAIQVISNNEYHINFLFFPASVLFIIATGA